jgi:hypothetical protein
MVSPAGSSRRTALRNSLISAAARVVAVHWVPPVNAQFELDTAIVEKDQSLVSLSPET